MMWGKHYGQMYEGSMVGMGALVFAVMGYVISKQMPDKELGAVVELNPKLLAAIFGEEQEDVEMAIRKLCEPDPLSRTPGHEGRRLLKRGTFQYQVVNGAKYLKIRSNLERQEQNRLNQAASRARKRGNHAGPTAREIAAEAGYGDGDDGAIEHYSGTADPIDRHIEVEIGGDR